MFFPQRKLKRSVLVYKSVRNHAGQKYFDVGFVSLCLRWSRGSKIIFQFKESENDYQNNYTYFNAVYTFSVT